MTPWQRTPGQQRVRELAADLAPTFRATYPARDDDVCQELLVRLAADPIVTTDPITAAPLGQQVFSHAYLNWLWAVSTPAQESAQPSLVRFDRVAYEGSVEGEWEAEVKPLAYTGGGSFRKRRTMRAVLSIVAGMPMYTDQLYQPIGKFKLSTESDDVIDTETSIVLSFMQETTPEEQGCIIKFLKSSKENAVLDLRQGRFHSDIDMLLHYCHELRAIRGRTPIQTRTLSVQRKLDLKPHKTVFEGWLEARNRHV